VTGFTTHHGTIIKEEEGGIVNIFTPKYQYWYRFDINASL